MDMRTGAMAIITDVRGLRGAAKDFREQCWNCRRPHDLCLCSRIKPFLIEPLLVLLVHPKEYKKSVGTAHLVKLSVKNSMLRMGKGADFDQDPEIQKILADPSYLPVVLFPGPSSLNLDTVDAAQIQAFNPQNKRLAIFLIDATWSLATKMLRLSETLTRLPRVSFNVKKRSQYQFRRQPQEFCLSTVEATHLLIESLSTAGISKVPEQNIHDHMLEVFGWMVERQVGFSARGEVRI